MKEETVLRKRVEKMQQMDMRARINPNSFYVYGLIGVKEECPNLSIAEKVARDFRNLYRVPIKIMKLSQDQTKYMETVKVEG